MPQELKVSVGYPIEMVACGMLESEEAFLHSRRTLHVDSILLGLRGQLHIEQEGAHYSMGPGDMLILHANQCHAGTRPSQNISYYWCSFRAKDNMDTLSTFAHEGGERMMPAESGGIPQVVLPEYMPLPFPDRANILFRQMINNTQMRYMPASVDHLGTALLIELYQQAANRRQTPLEDNARIGNIIAWLNANCSRPISAEELGRRFHYNERYLSHLIKSNTGYSLSVFINKLRVDKSKSLLLSTDLSIKRIACAVGFEDDHYYMRVFKRFEMISPTKYRNSYPHASINSN